jgi:hypothetical protein
MANSSLVHSRQDAAAWQIDDWRLSLAMMPCACVDMFAACPGAHASIASMHTVFLLEVHAGSEFFATPIVFRLQGVRIVRVTPFENTHLLS